MNFEFRPLFLHSHHTLMLFRFRVQESGVLCQHIAICLLGL